MKKIILTVTILGLAAAGVQTAKAGDREWAVAGKVLTGLVAASVIAHAIEPVPVYCSAGCDSCPAPGYGSCGYPAPAPRVVYVPPPVVVYRAPVCVAPPPLCVAPPLVSVRVGFGGGRPHHFRHGCW